ncbi:MAG: hypothetical protein MUE45_03810 [Methanoregulaceae archaeon]|jgi:hypothetical protein|nr:hypothetical protein [Methanoregulaceae archaeon]
MTSLSFLKEMLKREDLDLNIDIDYESGELFINCKGFSNGLSIIVDTFGVWVIRESISEKNDGIFTQGKKSHHTENTVTVIRAVARWFRDIEESSRNSKKR